MGPELVAFAAHPVYAQVRCHWRQSGDDVSQAPGCLAGAGPGILLLTYLPAAIPRPLTE